MADVITYKLSLLDAISAPMRKITGVSTEVAEKMSSLTAVQRKFEGENESLGGSILSLRSKMEMLRAERELISPANVADVAKYNKEISKLEREISKFDKLGVNDPFANLNAAAVIDLTQGVADGLASLSQPGIELNQSVADLSAITGIAGADLDHLASVARKVGADSGLGAGQATEAFKLLASQIDVSKIGIQGLETLQKETITLAQASGMTMADSANAMAGTINQFGLEASEANRIINVLAAGSKYGAAEIPELAQSFKVVGAAASAAGLNVESTAGAIEVLSKNNLKGAEAGTALRNIVLKMQTALGYDFTKTSLSDALDDLKPKMHDATYMSKLFGMENVAAAQFLVANADAVGEMTARVTDSNVAQEQAAIRTDTVQAKMAKMQAVVDNIKIGLFDLTGGTIGYASVLGEQLVMVSQMLPLMNLMRSGIVAITNAEKLKAIATGVSSVATKVMTGATWLFNAALAANPLVWVVAGVAALIGSIVLCWKKFEGFRVAIFGVWGVIKEFGKSLVGSIVDPFKQVLKGIGGVCSAIVSLVKGNFKEAATQAKAGFKDIGTGVVKGSPMGIAYNTIKGGNYKQTWQDGAQAGRDSWAKSQEAKETDVVAGSSQVAGGAPTVQSKVPNATSVLPTTTSTSSSKVLDLNDSNGSLKKSAAYSSIVGSLVPKVKRAAAAVAVPAALTLSGASATAMKLPEPMVNLPTPSDAFTLPSEVNGERDDSYISETKTINNGGKSYRIGKVCDSIVIHIENTDDKGRETIKEEIIRILEELSDE